MKKILCLILSAFLILGITACKSETVREITVAEAGYTCTALVNYGENISSNVFLRVIGGGVFSVTINTPEDIAGLTFSFDREEMQVSYGNLENAQSYATEYGGFADILNGVFLKFTTGRPTVTGKDGEFKYEGQSDLYPFTVVFNELGFPVSLTVPDAKLSATFANWQY